MYHSIAFGALFTTTFLHRFAASQFVGTIANVGAETSGLLMVTIENNSTGNYSFEARNNLFDNANPYQPLTVRTLAGTIVTLVGALYPYGELTDSAFITMSPGAIWQKELNMTEYIPFDPTLKIPTSECFSVSIPDGLFAVNTTDFVQGEDLATAFFKGDTVEIFVEAPALHLNITVLPGTNLQIASQTATSVSVGKQPAATLVQGTESAGPGGAEPTGGLGTSIDAYTQDVGSLFGPHKE